ncbi:3-oxoacyl-ACP synthase [Paenimyroides tangerinum]|uniref:3-oxoacyl-ACP synthase n=1 Tax=Paenimyroides tangerinum TaxID=2488728 RepID=A0A3P3W821_9FLAO|nr:3-oxoacyl-ACP synthase [Paenimyroides tangerinum]RRJ90598.1 3-oxoacyl-ACP synthase [Paenimyroides tangerinum]
MKESYYISNSCVIKNQKVFKNETLVFESNEADFNAFAKATYKNLQLEYPKFFKMDGLSKLAFLASEFLLSDKNEADNIALLFANKSASLDTDLKHQESIQDKDNFFPSPAIFVYTLANICIGEVSIRHQLKSESAFFCSENYQTEFMLNYTNYLLQNQKADKVLCGWAEFLNDDYQAVFYLIEKQGTKEHTINEIENLFK